MAEDRTYEQVKALLGERLDLGSSVTLRWVSRYSDPAELVIGAIRDHLTSRGEPCSSMVWFDVPAAQEQRAEGQTIHTLVQWEPFTLQPSLQCRQCDSHGAVEDGRWVPR